MVDKTQLGFYVDTAKCSGCKTCQVACKDRKDLKVGQNWRRVYEFGGGDWHENSDGTFEHSVFAYYMAISCNHCDSPACTKACPTGAMHKRKKDGLVHVDPSICIGCESCARACPYDAPQLDSERLVMTKCDGCFERLAEGLKPSCVNSCPQRALDFGTMEELKAKYGEGDAHIEPLPDARLTSPNLILKANKNGSLSGSGSGKVLNLREV